MPKEHQQGKEAGIGVTAPCRKQSVACHQLEGLRVAPMFALLKGL